MKRRTREINVFSISALDLFASALGAFMLIMIILLPFFPNTGDSPERVAEVQTRLDQVAEELAETQEDLAEAMARIAALETRVAAAEETRRQAEAAQAAAEAVLDAERAAREAAEAAVAAAEAAQAEAEAVLGRALEELENAREMLKRTFVLIVMSWPTGADIDLHVVDPQGREFYYAARTFPGTQGALEEDNINGPGNEIWLHPQAGPGEYRIYFNYFSKRNEASTTVRGLVLHQQGKIPLPLITLRNAGDKPLVATVVVDSEGNVRLR